MAGRQLVLVALLLVDRFVLSPACPTNCDCTNITRSSLTKVVCRGINIAGGFPDTTAEVILSNSNLREIPWDDFRTLKNLKFLNLNSISVDCDCKYYKYWNDVIRHKVNISGICGSPVAVRGQQLQTAGSKITNCTKVVSTSTLGVSPLPSASGVVQNLQSQASRTTATPSPLATQHVTSSSSVVRAAAVEPSSTAHASLVSSSILAVTTSTPTPKPSTAPKPTTGPTTTKEEVPATTEVVTTEPTTERATTPKPTTPRAPGAPQVKLNLLTPDVPIGSLAWVFCQVSGHPQPDVVMTLNGDPVDQLYGVTYNHRPNGVDFKFVAKFDAEVSCSAKNELGRDKRVIRVPIDTLSIGYLLMNVKLIEETYTDKLKDKTSEGFNELQTKISDAFAVVFREFVGYYGATLVSVSPGSVIANVLVKTANASEAKVKKIIEQEMVDAKLASLSVDRYYYSFQTATACSGEYLNTTWSDMVPGQTIIEECPRGAKGFARRNCTANGDWYYPDYTQCKSDSFADLHKQMTNVTERSKSDDKIQHVLRNLTRLTTANEDHAQMSGDIVLAVEIMEKLVSFTKKERNSVAGGKDEVKLVLHVASNLLQTNNEQEFIVAQKVVQTASALIRSLDVYGLQSALALTDGRDDLTFIIQENIIMGAGVVHPVNITKDVTFPDYDVKVVDRVRKQWNSSSFLVIDIDVIKQMKEAQQIKLAGFMYKTLTRILSAESAYSQVGYGYEINSAVIAMGVDPKPKEPFAKPVIIASNNLENVEIDGDQPICAYWDFELNPPNGGWSEVGCWYTHYNTQNTTCLCDHMTNFAVLREKPLALTGALKSKRVDPPFLLCILIGCIVMVCFCAITLFLLILAAWRMKPDRTWGMHMFVCATLIVAFALIIVGLFSYNDIVFCNLLSLLVHYFYLCAFTWILAEAMYMRIWTTQTGPKKVYWIGYFFLGFIVPGIPMVVTWLLNGVTGFESPWSCWMILFPGYLFWVFFGPALFFTLLAILGFRGVWRLATGPLRVPLKATYWRTRFRVHVRYSIAILIMLLITWLMGVLVITFFQKVAWIVGLVMCILFILCCAVTGLLIVVFYCIMDRQFDDAVRDCCCFCCRGRRGKYWVGGDQYWAEEHPVQEIQQEEAEELMPPESEEHEMILEPVEEPLIKMESRPPAESFNSLDDPLYERVKRPGEESAAEPEEEEPDEPVYAKVHKPGRDSVPDEEDADPFPIARPGSPRFLRGLTREEVLRMAKKSDASRRHLRDYESPKGSRDDVSEHPLCMLNQQEMDEELKHFRSFFAEQKKMRGDESPTTSTPRGTPLGTPIPRTSTTSSTSSTRTKKVVKKKKKTTSASSDGKTTRDESTEEHSVFTFESQTSEDSPGKSATRGTTSPIAPPRSDSLHSLTDLEEKSPPLPPRTPGLLDDDEEEELGAAGLSAADSTAKDDDDDDDSLTDVSADDLDKYDSDEDKPLDGSRPTEV